MQCGVGYAYVYINAYYICTNNVVYVSRIVTLKNEFRLSIKI